MVIMASASDIAKDMTESIKLIKARLAVDGPEGAETLKLKRKLATSAATKIGHMVALSPAGAEELLEVANGIGLRPRWPHHGWRSDRREARGRAGRRAAAET